MKRYILFTLFLVSIVNVLAVTLPSTSYNLYDSYNNGNDGFTMSIGVNYVNYSTLSASAYSGSCTSDAAWTGDVSDCQKCCSDEFEVCMQTTKDYLTCRDLKGLCNAECDNKALNEEDTPLGEVFLLLPFVFAYAFIRKRKQA